MKRIATHLVFPILIAATLAGCQAQSSSTTNQPSLHANTLATPSNAHIFPTDAVRSTTYTAQPERFEFARLDAQLSPRSPASLRATQQWPQAPQPLERRILFRWWEQR